MSVDSFLSLLEVHQGLLEALLDVDLVRAGAELDRFEEGLRRHIRDEEEFLLPVYRRGEAPPGGSVELYVTEHRRMLELIGRFRGMLRAIEPRPGFKRQVLALLEEESALKSLMHHHDLRERSFLYPALDRLATTEERRDLISRCRAGPL
jgi:iron-sulfur cluster repair protein YtfE (RIC family)